MAKRKTYRAIYTVHWGCYRFDAGTEFTSDDLQPPTDDAALEPLPERELRDWLESRRVVDITPKPKPRKPSKEAAKPKAATPPVEADAPTESDVAEEPANIKVPKHDNWRKENMKP